MDRWNVLAGVTLALLAVYIGIILGTLTAANDLFTGSEWQLASIISLVLFVGALLAIMAVGSPWNRWKRTPYW